MPSPEMKTVHDVMLTTNSFPVLPEDALFKEALEAMGKHNLGIVCIVDREFHLLGIVTDGDIRRKLLKVQKPFSAFFVDDALQHAIRNPVTIDPESTLSHAVEVMGEKHIWDLPVVDKSSVLIGLLHLHPAIRAVLGVHNL